MVGPTGAIFVDQFLVDRQALAPGQTLQEVDEERIIGEYQDIEGQKVPKKIVVNHDGKKFMEAEVTEMKFLDKVDDSQFEKP